MVRNKILTGILILLMITSIAFAGNDLCTDSDNGPKDGRKPTDDVLTTRGSTKYGIQIKEDICVISENADVQTSESPYLKEYYCFDDTRQSEIFDCRDYGFEKCVDGVCVGTGTGTQNRTITRVTPDCGNKITEKDKGEECDPPGSVCLEGDDYGICRDDCTCRWHSEQVAGEADEQEDEEEDEQQITDIEEDEETEEEQKEEKEEDKYPLPEVTVPDVGEPKNFSQEPGIKVTRGISGFFKKLWNWFINLF